MSASGVPSLLALFLASTGFALFVDGCGDNSEQGTSATASSSVSSSSVGGGTSVTSTSATAMSTGGAGGGVGGQGGSGTGGDYKPTPADIQYAAVSPLPSGEQILFNDWLGLPNAVLAMTPDGKTTTTVFKAFRVWAMGATTTGDTVAFACGDPHQKEHYGTDVGDAIQHTWLYHADTQTISLAAYGNINDECHTFGPGNKRLYVCRRYDFQADGSDKGYRLGRIDLTTLAFEFLTVDDPDQLALHPAPFPDESAMLYTNIKIAGTTQSRELDREALPVQAPAVVRAKADHPVISPDGSRYLFTDYASMGSLFSANLDGSMVAVVVNRHAQEVAYSPDGKHVVYLLRDDAANCSHIEVVKSDGSEADAPTRIRDCSKTNEFVTQVSWVSH